MWKKERRAADDEGGFKMYLVVGTSFSAESLAVSGGSFRDPCHAALMSL